MNKPSLEHHAGTSGMNCSSELMLIHLVLLQNVLMKDLIPSSSNHFIPEIKKKK